eukprot:jgi/Astpho2/4986/Aster-x1268
MGSTGPTFRIFSKKAARNPKGPPSCLAEAVSERVRGSTPTLAAASARVNIDVVTEEGWSAGCTLSRRRQRLRVQAKLLPARRKQSLNQRIRTAKSAIERTADHLRAQLIYYEFCADETTRKWQWENRTRRETAFWNAVGLWLGGFCYTAVYMVLTPASWVFTIIIPLIYSLIIFDKPFVSPVVFAMLMASPFKFVPYCPIPLVW